MDDTISRQAAIEALNTAAENWNIAEPYHEGMRTGFRNAARIMLSLPSAQQEIIRCGDCKHFDDRPGWQGCQAFGKWFGETEMWESDFCSKAERREDDAG